MDIGDLVYVIFVLMSIVLGIFGKKKKKNPKTTSEPSNTFDLESFIREAYGNTENSSNSNDKSVEEDKISEPTHTVHYPPTNPPQSKYHNSSFKKELKKKKEQSRTRVSKVKSQSSNSPIFENEISDTAPSSEFEFDAQKAVIYSEILKRPDY
jgi:preprotein translocase subunit SecG